MIQGYHISCIVGITHIHEKFLYLLNQAKRRKNMSVLKMKKKNRKQINQLNHRQENIKNNGTFKIMQIGVAITSVDLQISLLQHITHERPL